MEEDFTMSKLALVLCLNAKIIYYVIYLEKIVELSNTIKKATREDYEAQILELGNTIKECKDHLSREKIEKEKIYRGYMHEKFQLESACE